MGRSKRIILLTSLFLCVFAFIFIYRFTSDYKDFEKSITDNALYTSKYNNNLSNCGWIPNWGAKEGLESLKANINVLDCISPVLYEVNSDGSLKNISPSNLQEIINFAKANNVKIYPTIAMFDHEIFTQVLQNEINYQRHVDAIVELTQNSNYDGIDLDYESTKLSDNDQYKRMIIELSSRIHKKNKKLIITVLSKWGDDVEYSALKETHKVQDWRFIGEYADYVRIMAYDYTYSRSKYPGPIAPLDWIEKIIVYAKTKIPDNKIILGIHLYSYQWSTEANTLIEAKNMPFVFMYDYLNNTGNDSGTNFSYVYEGVLSILTQFKGYAFDYQGEQVFIYQKEIQSSGKYENRVLVYIDPAGVMARKKLAARYNLAGVCFWRIGDEANLIQEQ